MKGKSCNLSDKIKVFTHEHICKYVALVMNMPEAFMTS